MPFTISVIPPDSMRRKIRRNTKNANTLPKCLFEPANRSLKGLTAKVFRKFETPLFEAGVIVVVAVTGAICVNCEI